MAIVNFNSISGVSTISATTSMTVGTGVTITTNGIVGITSINSGQLGGSRNVIINGSMVVSQRGFTGSSGATGNTDYAIDRFRIEHNQDGAVSAGQTTMNSTFGGNAYADGFQSALHYRVTTADASLAAGQYVLIRQFIEGFNVQGFKKGTANAQQYTLSFWVRSSLTGTYIAELYDNDNNRQVSKSYTIDTANTWEKKTLTYPADTTGVFDNDNGLSLGLNWWLAAGSTYSGGTLNTSWATITNANRTVGQVNFLATAGNNFFLTGVQLEVGPTATEFERRSFDDELSRCQRYFYTSRRNGSGSLNSYRLGYTGIGYGNYAIHGMRTFPVQMRAAPSITAYAYGFNADLTTFGDERTGVLVQYYFSGNVDYVTHTYGLAFGTTPDAIVLVNNGENTVTGRQYQCAIDASAEL